MTEDQPCQQGTFNTIVRDRSNRKVAPMSDDNPNTDNSSDLRATVTSYTKSCQSPEGIPEEHQPYVKTILAMDPITDVRGSLSDDNAARPGYQLKIDGLPPELQGEARQRLHEMGEMDDARRAKAETKIVSDLARGMLGSIRARTGVHRDSLPFHKEQAEIAAQVNLLVRKRQGYIDGVDKVVDVQKGEDPDTGELVANPVYWLSDHTRAKWQEQITELDRQIRLLVNEDGSFGIEGQRRMDRALKESAALMHKLDTMRREEAEAQALSEKMVSEERVAKRAELLAKAKRRNG